MDDKQVISSLTKILDRDSVISDADIMKSYSNDALDVTRALPPNFKLKLPIAVVRPKAETDVVKIVKFANKNRISIVPYGGGTGLMGGAATIKRGMVMDLKDLDGMEINQEDLTVTAEAGVIIKRLDSELRKHGLMFAHDPWSASYATVGGATCTNGVGYLACKYGSMGEQVLGLRAVTADGSILGIKPARKKSSGMDLKDLFIGSEGVFGVITSATLKVYQVPESEQVNAFQFENFEKGYKAVTEMFSYGIKPASLDLFEAYDIGVDAETKLWLQDEEGTRLYVMLDGFREKVNAESAKTKSIVKQFGGTEIDSNVSNEYWKNRYDIAERYITFIRSKSRNTNIKFDFIQVSIPAGRLLEFDKVCMDIASKHKVMVQGHGIWQAPEFYSMNLFAHSAKANDRMYDAIDKMLRHASKIGTMEYCHGVGTKLAHLMKEEHSDGIQVMKKIKRTLDPNNIMNPGKLAL
ncbi:MAG: alkyldihydroxyacetonephosphate synthase [Candidatus Nitrosomirales archaeon]|jgi:alkyldihydroxyacetonephosphate synthase